MSSRAKHKRSNAAWVISQPQFNSSSSMVCELGDPATPPRPPRVPSRHPPMFNADAVARLEGTGAPNGSPGGLLPPPDVFSGHTRALHRERERDREREVRDVAPIHRAGPPKTPPRRRKKSSAAAHSSPSASPRTYKSSAGTMNRALGSVKNSLHVHGSQVPPLQVFPAPPPPPRPSRTPSPQLVSRWSSSSEEDDKRTTWFSGESVKSRMRTVSASIKSFRSVSKSSEGGTKSSAASVRSSKSIKSVRSFKSWSARSKHTPLNSLDEVPPMPPVPPAGALPPAIVTLAPSTPGRSRRLIGSIKKRLTPKRSRPPLEDLPPPPERHAASAKSPSRRLTLSLGGRKRRPLPQFDLLGVSDNSSTERLSTTRLSTTPTMVPLDRLPPVPPLPPLALAAQSGTHNNKSARTLDTDNGLIPHTLLPATETRTEESRPCAPGALEAVRVGGKRSTRLAFPGQNAPSAGVSRTPPHSSKPSADRSQSHPADTLDAHSPRRSRSIRERTRTMINLALPSSPTSTAHSLRKRRSHAPTHPPVLEEDFDASNLAMPTRSMLKAEAILGINLHDEDVVSPSPSVPTSPTARKRDFVDEPLHLPPAPHASFKSKAESVLGVILHRKTSTMSFGPSVGSGPTSSKPGSPSMSSDEDEYYPSVRDKRPGRRQSLNLNSLRLRSPSVPRSVSSSTTTADTTIATPEAYGFGCSSNASSASVGGSLDRRSHSSLSLDEEEDGTLGKGKRKLALAHLLPPRVSSRRDKEPPLPPMPTLHKHPKEASYAALGTTSHAKEPSYGGSASSRSASGSRSQLAQSPVLPTTLLPPAKPTALTPSPRPSMRPRKTLSPTTTSAALAAAVADDLPAHLRRYEEWPLRWEPSARAEAIPPPPPSPGTPSTPYSAGLRDAQASQAARKGSLASVHTFGGRRPSAVGDDLCVDELWKHSNASTHTFGAEGEEQWELEKYLDNEV